MEALDTESVLPKPPKLTKKTSFSFDRTKRILNEMEKTSKKKTEDTKKDEPKISNNSEQEKIVYNTIIPKKEPVLINTNSSSSLSDLNSVITSGTDSDDNKTELDQIGSEKGSVMIDDEEEEQVQK
eukprot:CAMPEP_0117429462 /NCGR_PEP_ID=MMETSP0758-20121206/9023_1 /TAXON_ID=63605 /ORGANISM="Percolomonas cosmopolitus, Strain AE-1 (ATCC 50343)" /LENGTH=125 /DNA_ID=CAMNT_0005216549 /DNA_START=436 /DNA_END=810 /DNA_ORIENTATION=-